jgi:MoxR-like ATPase
MQPETTGLTGDDYRVLKEIGESHRAIRAELAKRIVGQDEVVEQVLTAFFAGGHVLLLGVPGLAKTLLIRTLAEILGLKFSRVQFTPDLMPSDITGSDVLVGDGDERRFQFIGGPIFANFVLADEINRTPPKTQSALLEAMEEYTVTVAGKTYDMPDPYFVMATQNPIEQEGTYVLPAAALDRFLFTVVVDYPTQADELNMLFRTTAGRDEPVRRLLDETRVRRMLEVVRKVNISDETLRYAVALVRASRPEFSGDEQIKDMVECGGSPRATQALIMGAKARAALEGRDEATPADIRAIALPAMHHRVLTNFHAEADNVTSRDIVRKLIASVPRPAGDVEPEDRRVRVPLSRWLWELIIGRPGRRGGLALAGAGGRAGELSIEERQRLQLDVMMAGWLDMAVSLLLPALVSVFLFSQAHESLSRGGEGAKFWLGLAAIVIGPVLFMVLVQAVMTAIRGGSVGCLMRGLTVMDRDRMTLGLGAALVRSLLLLGGSFVYWALPILEIIGLRAADERSLVDRIAGTQTVRTTA